MKKTLPLFFVFCFMTQAALAAIPMTPKTRPAKDEGMASWYSVEACKYNKDDACPTADGSSLYALEKRGELFCASNDYPLGTLLTVTNKRNGEVVVVRVRDRGGFEKYGRIMDLCKAAYFRIAGPLDQIMGTMRVKIERAK